MARVFRSVVWREDPLRLLARFPVWLYSKWVSATYPFAAIGKNVRFHYTWDFRRYGAHRVKLGNSVLIGKDVHFGAYCPNGEPGEPMIIVEDGCGIHRGAQISARNCIHIERDVIVSAGTLLMDHNHEFQDVTVPIKDQGLSAGGTIRIEQGCWIGRNAAIVCNQGDLVIGRNSVIAANALVTRSCPPYSVLIGNPARVASQYDPRQKAWVTGSARPAVPVSIGSDLNA